MPHEIGSGNCIPDSHCWIHDEDEALQHPYFRVCLECSHVYRTAEELQVEWLENYPEDRSGAWGPPMLKPEVAIPVEKIFFCPVCMHDF